MHLNFNSTFSFYFSMWLLKKFKITYVVHIVFLLDFNYINSVATQTVQPLTCCFPHSAIEYTSNSNISPHIFLCTTPIGPSRALQLNAFQTATDTVWVFTLPLIQHGLFITFHLQRSKTHNLSFLPFLSPPFPSHFFSFLFPSLHSSSFPPSPLPSLLSFPLILSSHFLCHTFQLSYLENLQGHSNLSTNLLHMFFNQKA